MAALEPHGILSPVLDSGPAALANLVLWLKSDTIPGMSDGATPTSWPDGSGQGNNATRHGTDTLPTWKAAIQNGLPVVRFPNTASSGFETALVLSSPCTLFVVFSCASDVGGQHRAIQSKTLNWLIGAYSGSVASFDSTAFISQNALAAVNGTFYAACNVCTGGASHFYVDGVDRTQSGGAGLGPAGVVLSAPSSAASASQPLNGDIGEVIAYSRALSTGERQGIESYLRTRWGTA